MTRKKIILILVAVAIIAMIGMSYLSGLTFESFRSTKTYTNTEKSLSLRYPKQYQLQLHGGDGISIGKQASSTNGAVFETSYLVAYGENKTDVSAEKYALNISCYTHIELKPECWIVNAEPFITKSKIEGTIFYVEETGRYKDKKGVPIIFQESYGPFYKITHGSQFMIVYPANLVDKNTNLIELHSIAESIKIVK